MAVLGGPLLALMPVGIYLQSRGWRIYRRIGDYSIGVSTFFWQLAQPGLNFPGPSVLEAVIDRQPGELQAAIVVHRLRLRAFRRAFLWYLGYAALFLLAASIGRKLFS
ncbi:hypothetical protein [Bradyrhizobium sp. SRS-191]|uniref:hypothetical protein n=1 Tax=Bradyrhizobium sp. SRS-191 TaxID=2962606 RepID=UPI00211DD783|nr:hypothetical protein [Bradyrhizobium sp. SRS-191]